MVFRETEQLGNCISWIPRNEENITDRAVITAVGMPVLIGRLSEGNNQITGFATPLPPIHDGKLYVADLNLDQERAVSEYDVLVPLLLTWFNFNPSMDK